MTREPFFDLSNPRTHERTLSCNGCGKVGEVVKVLTIGSRHESWTNATEYRMCRDCARVFYEHIVA